jgi:hypothetical protein
LIFRLEGLRKGTKYLGQVRRDNDQAEIRTVHLLNASLE